MSDIVERYTEADLDQLRAHYLAELDKKDAEIERLEANQERMWCKSCGTVTRGGECDCTSCGQPETQNLVNYADSRQEDISTLLAEIEQLEEALKVCRELKDGYRADLLKLRQSPDDNQPLSSGGPPQQ